MANLDGSNSIFIPDSFDSTVLQRCAELDVHPTGVLWGWGELRTSAAVAELQRGAAQQRSEFSAGLAAAGLNQERRPLRMAVRNFAWTWEHTRLILEFRLTRGLFATAVLAEILDAGTDALGEDEDA